MIKEGALESPKPDAIIAQHVFTQLPAGKAGFFAGRYMASSDELYIKVKGKGGHAAVPAGVVNPLYIAAKLLVVLQDLAEEFSIAAVPTVLAFGKITGLGATNVIPDEVKIEGTFRTMEEQWRFAVHERLKKLIHDFSATTDGSVEIEIRVGYPCLVNDQTVTDISFKSAAQYLGAENAVQLTTWMASEDFAFYSQQVPACFYRLGTGNPDKHITSPVHTPTFSIDEDALEVATGLMAWLALGLLKE